VSIPRYVEAWSENHWDWFKHWITDENYRSGEWVCVEVDENFELPDGMEWGEILSPVESYDPPLPAFGGYELDPEASCEITAKTRDICGAPVLYLDISADVPCWVVVRESNMPGWKATVDGKRASIAIADFLFMGIPVPAGQHQVKLVYKTPGLTAGEWISSIGWAIFLVTIIYPVVIHMKKS
jgi:hypothetical protein